MIQFKLHWSYWKKWNCFYLIDTNKKLELKIITSWFKTLLKALEFSTTSANVILELIQQAATKDF